METETNEYKVSLRIKIQRVILKTILKLIFRIFCRVKIEGKENLPADKPYLIITNHISYFDAPFVLSFWDFIPEALGAADLQNRSGISTIVKLFGYIPVNRYTFDRTVLETAIRVLNAGKCLMIAPEGTRSHDLVFKQGHPGVAYIADKAHVPVLPVAVIGASGDLPKKMFTFKFPEIRLHIGELITLPELQGKGSALREARQYHTDYMLYSLSKLLPESYKGYYADLSDDDFQDLIAFQKPYKKIPRK